MLGSPPGTIGRDMPHSAAVQNGGLNAPPGDISENIAAASSNAQSVLLQCLGPLGLRNEEPDMDFLELGGCKSQMEVWQGLVSGGSPPPGWQTATLSSHDREALPLSTRRD